MSQKETGEIVNRVQRSGVVTIDFEEWYPQNERNLVDLKPWLWQEMVLKEKDFREAVEQHNWEQYQDQYVAINCSVDAIIPTWAYMLIADALEPFAAFIFVGTPNEMEKAVFRKVIDKKLIPEEYEDKRIVIKGCSKYPISPDAYALVTAKLKPFAKTIMFGEPCSTVPIYRKRKSY
ncbi:MAG: hypothetical protein CL843_20000 [Crocinitomicaceae bacterium]|nr:hypothetical protein [Crocinitomicaceae bacterium]